MEIFNISILQTLYGNQGLIFVLHSLFHLGGYGNIEYFDSPTPVDFIRHVLPGRSAAAVVVERGRPAG